MRGGPMFSKYEEYLPMDKSLSFEEMADLHRQMMLSIGNDSDALELYEELIQTANQYSTFRSNWCIWSIAEKLDKGVVGLGHKQSFYLAVLYKSYKLVHFDILSSVCKIIIAS